MAKVNAINCMYAVFTVGSKIKTPTIGQMKIVRLKTAVVESNFDWTFVRIETDEGVHGLGECFFAPGLTSILRSLEPVIRDEESA